MKKIFALLLAAAGGVLFGYSSATAEGRPQQGLSFQGSSSGFSIVVGGGGRHFDHRHFGPRSDHRHFSDRHFDPHFDRHDRHFHRNDFHDRKFRHGHFDGRHFDSRSHDRRFGGNHRFHDRRFFRPHGGIIFYGSSDDSDTWSDIYQEKEGVVVEDDSRTVTYRGNEIVPDDPDSRTVTYRGSRVGRTIGNVPEP